MHNRLAEHGGYGLSAPEETVQSALALLEEQEPKSQEARMLRRLLRRMPELSSKRCWMNTTAALVADEVGVTEPLRVPLQDNSNGDLWFLSGVVADMEIGGADWSLALERLPHTSYVGVSVWRVPPKGLL